ncbi:MAG: hypothetical protein ACI82G_003160, partial [Bradymonadia bacterium]
MNAFRILFLIVTLFGSLSVAAVNLVPSIVERQAATALEDRASLEARLLDEMENSAHERRAALADGVARSESLKRSLSTPAGFNPPPLDAMFRQASSATWTDHATEIDALALMDATGALVDERSRLGAIGVSDLLQAASLTSLEGQQTRFVGVDNRLFALTTTPVLVSERPMGAIVLVVEYDDDAIARRRSGHGASAVYFVDREIAASNLTSGEATTLAAATIRRAGPGAIGTPSMLRTRDTVTADGLNYLIAPVRVGQMAPEGSIGVVVVVEAEAPPSAVIAIIADGIAKGTGTMRIWVILVAGLFVFFAGLLLLDTALTQQSRELGQRISDSATANDPIPLTVAAYPDWLKSVAENFNAFLEAYRSHSPSARKQRHESSASILIDPSTQPITLPKAEASLSASDEMWKVASPEAPRPSRDDSRGGLIDLASGESPRMRPVTDAVLPELGAPSDTFDVSDIELEPVTVEEAEAELSGEAAATAGSASAEKTLMLGAAEARALLTEVETNEDGNNPKGTSDEQNGITKQSNEFNAAETTDVDSMAADFLKTISGEHPVTRSTEPDAEAHSSLERPIAAMDDVHRLDADSTVRRWGDEVTGTLGAIQDDADPLEFDLEDYETDEDDEDGDLADPLTASDESTPVPTDSDRSVVDGTTPPPSGLAEVPQAPNEESDLLTPPDLPVREGQGDEDVQDDERMPDPSGSFQTVEEKEERGFLASDDEVSQLISAIHTGSHEIPRDTKDNTTVEAKVDDTDVDDLLAEADREIASRDLHSESDDLL